MRFPDRVEVAADGVAEEDSTEMILLPNREKQLAECRPMSQGAATQAT